MSYNKYHSLLYDILENGEWQQNKKGRIKYLLNEVLFMTPEDLKRIFNDHQLPYKKLATELELFMAGETNIEVYTQAGIHWWAEYEGENNTLEGSYPDYFKKLPSLVEKINREKRPSKQYVLFMGETEKKSIQPPCLSLMHFQIDQGELVITVYQRSCDSNLGLPCDIYQTYLISQIIDLPLKGIVFHIANAHIYENNIGHTISLLETGIHPKYELNV